MKKRSFVKSGTNIIANYDYTDVAEGTGFRDHYLYIDKTSAATAYKTTNNTNIYSKVEYTNMSPAQGAAAKLYDQDFDIIFNLPQLVKGTAETQIFVNIGSTAGTVATCYLIITIKKVSDATTTLGTATTDTETKTGIGAAERVVYTTPISIASTYHFKKGDILRFNIQVWGQKSDANVSTISLFHDPAGRGTAVNSLPTTSHIKIPFRINV